MPSNSARLFLLCGLLFLGAVGLRSAVDLQSATGSGLPNGVASGDTTQTSTVLWARSNALGRMFFIVATDAGILSVASPFQIDPGLVTFIVRVLTVVVTDVSLPVKVNVTRLMPGRQYYYRIIDSHLNTGGGRFVTSAADGVRAGLRFGVTGDWRGELSPYPSVRNAAESDLDFFVFLGDTIYADYASDAVRNPDGSRKDQVETIHEFRAKHAEVYSTRFDLNTLADLRAATSVLATIDDHEVTDDFAGGAPPSSDPRFQTFPGDFINDTPPYDNGIQAFQEYQPLRDEFYGVTGDPRTAGKRKLYRFRTYGEDAAVIVLDGRSFRDTELTPANLAVPGDPVRFILESFDSRRTMLGRAQLADTKRDLLVAHRRGITWKFVVVPEPIQNLGVVAAQDRFEGYSAERTEILRFIHENGIRNVVFISADLHGTLVNNLTYQERPFGPHIRTSAFEVVTGSVAFDAPFGPEVINLAGQLGLIGPAEKAFYDSLPVAADADDVLNDKDDFLKELVRQQIAPFGYDPLGLTGSPVEATLLEGDYIAVHTYGWTEFQIDAHTQQLRVTTYGIPPYSEIELLASPAAITNRVPVIVSRFQVAPRRNR